MIHRVVTIIALAVLTAVLTGAASGADGSGSTMAGAQAAGWDCNPQVLIFGYYHCAPPGKPSVLDMIQGTTDAPIIVLRVFRPDGTFAGIERLLRADLYAGQGCPQDSLVNWDLLPFGYYACHNFDT
jgi:hypothetical protein